MTQQQQAIEPDLMQTPASEASLEPASQQDLILSQIATQVGGLSSKQCQVLGSICLNMVSGNIQTDVDIAADLGIDRRTVMRYRRNPRFGAALALLMRSLAQGTADKALSNLMKLSEKDTKATEIWLRIAKVFDPVQKTFNVNANLQAASQPGTFGELIDEFLIGLGAAGYPIEKLLERYNELKAEGAF